MVYTDFVHRLQDLGRQTLSNHGQLWLYGSRARGTAHKDSDWDLLILLDQEQPLIDDFKRYAFPLTMLGAEHNQEIIPQIYTKKQWDALSFTPFHKNVEHDKIVLV